MRGAAARDRDDGKTDSRGLSFSARCSNPFTERDVGTIVTTFGAEHSHDANTQVAGLCGAFFWTKYLGPAAVAIRIEELARVQKSNLSARHVIERKGKRRATPYSKDVIGRRAHGSVGPGDQPIGRGCSSRRWGFSIARATASCSAVAASVMPAAHPHQDRPRRLEWRQQKAQVTAASCIGLPE